MWNVTREDLMAARQIVATASDFGVPGTKRFGNPDGQNMVVVFAQVYGGEHNGYAVAHVLGQNPGILHANTQVCFVAVRNTDATPESNLNRLPADGDFSAGDFPRAEEIRRCLSQCPVKFAIDIEENGDPKEQSGWLLSTVGTATATDSFSAIFPHTVLLRGITAQQETTGSRPFGTIMSCPGFESLTWPLAKKGGMKAALRSVFGSLAYLGWLADTIRLIERERVQEVYDAVGIVPVPDRSKKYELDPTYMRPFSYAEKGSILGSSADGEDVVMPCDGHLVLANPEPRGNDPYFYVVEHAATQTELIQMPKGL